MRKGLPALGLVAPAGCGGGSGGGGSAEGAASIVDPAGSSPLVNSLEVEPGISRSAAWRATRRD